MCKLAIITKHDSAKIKTIISSVWQEMAKTEKDGFGAAWVSPSGKIGYVKSSQSAFIPDLPAFCAAFSEGNGLGSDGGALIIHGRTATCGVNVGNTHPMMGNNCALVHNGVVSSKRFHNTESTCDSELLLHAWRADGIDAVAREISGYYAFAILQRIRGKTVLDVVRDDKANLKVGKIDAGWAFATTPALLAVLGSSYLADYKANTHTSFVNGEVYSVEKFIPAEVDKSLDEAASKALDRTPALPRYKGSTNWRSEMAQAELGWSHL